MSWCPEVYERLADGTSYRYRVGAALQVTGSQVTLERTIVSFGRSGGRERRVAAEAAALTGEPLFGANAVISLDDLTMDTATVQGSARSNGNITGQASQERTVARSETVAEVHTSVARLMRELHQASDLDYFTPQIVELNVWAGSGRDSSVVQRVRYDCSQGESCSASPRRWAKPCLPAGC